MSIVFEFGQARTYLEHTCYPNRKKSLHLGYVPVPTVDKVLVHIVQDIFSTNHLVRRTLPELQSMLDAVKPQGYSLNQQVLHKISKLRSLLLFRL